MLDKNIETRTRLCVELSAYVEEWLWTIKREKSIYHTLNLFKNDVAGNVTIHVYYVYVYYVYVYYVCMYVCMYITLYVYYMYIYAIIVLSLFCYILNDR